MKSILRKLLEWATGNSKEIALLRNRMRDAEAELAALHEMFREQTTVSADVSVHGKDPSYVIVVGRYRNVDYVRTFVFHQSQFDETIRHLVELDRRYGKTYRTDAPPAFRAVLDRQLY